MEIKAVVIDGVTKKDYERKLEERLINIKQQEDLKFQKIMRKQDL